MQERTGGRGFARGVRPRGPNPGTGVRGIFKKIRIPLSWDYRNALGPDRIGSVSWPTQISTVQA